MVRSLLLGAWLLLAGAAGAGALTVDEILQLSRAGVSDDVMLAQIQADALNQPLSPSQTTRLRRANVSETVVESFDYAPQPVYYPPTHSYGYPYGRRSSPCHAPTYPVQREYYGPRYWGTGHGR